MIGLGKWKCHVDTMLFKGDAFIEIKDKNGEYDFELDVADIDLPDIDVGNITEEGNTLSAIATTSALKGKEIPITLTFDGDTLTGMLKVPLIGKIKLKDGKRVSDD